MEEIISAKEINKRINLPPGIVLYLLKDANFTAQRGEFVTLSGTSGSGKSALLRVILGYDKDVEGNVIIQGRNIREMNETELEEFRINNIGICYDDKAPIILPFTVKENICRRLQAFFDKDIEQKAKDIIATFEIDAIVNQKVISGSFIDLYKLMLAVAFCGPPPIVVIDEVLDYFPLDERQKLLGRILSIQKQHQITLVLVTHEIDIVCKADRALNIMNQTIYKVDINRLREIAESNKDNIKHT